MRTFDFSSLAKRYSTSLTLEGVCYCIQNYFCQWSSHFELFSIYFSRWSLCCELFCYSTAIQHYFCCFGSWMQNILATLRIVLPLDQNYSSIRVESNFVRSGLKNSSSVGTKVVFFGVLRFLSSMRSVVSGTLQIETVFHVMLQHRTIRYFSACCLQMKADYSFLLSSLFSLVQILRG